MIKLEECLLNFSIPPKPGCAYVGCKREARVNLKLYLKTNDLFWSSLFSCHTCVSRFRARNPRMTIRIFNLL